MIQPASLPLAWYSTRSADYCARQDVLYQLLPQHSATGQNLRPRPNEPLKHGQLDDIITLLVECHIKAVNDCFNCIIFTCQLSYFPDSSEQYDDIYSANDHSFSLEYLAYVIVLLCIGLHSCFLSSFIKQYCMVFVLNRQFCSVFLKHTCVLFVWICRD